MRLTREQDETILRCLEMFDAGWNFNQIATAVGKGRGWVRNKILDIHAAMGADQ